MKRKILLSLIALATITAWVIFTHRAKPIGILSPEDKQIIRSEIRGRTSEEILQIIPRDTVVIVNTGTNGVCWHCYELKRKNDGWIISWEGS